MYRIIAKTLKPYLHEQRFSARNRPKNKKYSYRSFAKYLRKRARAHTRTINGKAFYFGIRTPIAARKQAWSVILFFKRITYDRDSMWSKRRLLFSVYRRNKPM